MRTTNAKSRQFVQELREFKASNLSARIEGKFYVVYSYDWYPLFIYSYVEKKWFSNKDRYSASTSRQYSQSRPNYDSIELTHEQMKDLLQAGGK